MRKIIPIIFFCIALVIFTSYVIKQKIGDLRPMVLPPKNIEPSPIKSRNSAKIGTAPAIPLILPSGFSIGIFAQNLEGARVLAFDSGGTLLVSLTSSGKIVALSDTTGSGVADKTQVIASGLNNPHGLVFHNEYLYLAEETKVSRFKWNTATWALIDPKIIVTLPKGGRHFTRSLVFDNNNHLYITIGSTCDTCIETNPWVYPEFNRRVYTDANLS